MKEQIVNIMKLKDDGYNPRNISDQDKEELKKSLLEKGWVVPLIVNKKKGRENIIISGHQKVDIVKELKKQNKNIIEIKRWDENKSKEIKIKEDLLLAPVLYVYLDEETEKKWNLSLNKIGGTWDYAKLSEILQSLDDIDFTGFSESDRLFYKDVSQNLDLDLDPSDIMGEIKPERISLTFFPFEKDYPILHKYFGGTNNHDVTKLKEIVKLAKKNGIK